jgi:hypothetical protein
MSSESKSDIDNIEVSVKTVIAVTNMQINLLNLHKYIALTPYKPVEKKRGRKKKSLVEQAVQILPEGSITGSQNGKDIRGIFANRKKKKTKETFFLHCTSLEISLDVNKFINVKVSKNGKFQITGPKHDEHAIKVIKYIYQHIRTAEIVSNVEIIKFKNENDKQVTCLFNTVMQNFDYNIGFNISREKLNSFINENTYYCSIYEGSINTGVNIKVPSDHPNDKFIKKLYYSYDVHTEEEKSIIEEVEYEEYVKSMDVKEVKKKNKKDNRHTFLVFASGSIIMSSRGPSMNRLFKELITLLKDNRSLIEEKVT